MRACLIRFALKAFNEAADYKVRKSSEDELGTYERIFARKDS